MVSYNTELPTAVIKWLLQKAAKIWTVTKNILYLKYFIAKNSFSPLLWQKYSLNNHNVRDISDSSCLLKGIYSCKKAQLPHRSQVESAKQVRQRRKSAEQPLYLLSSLPACRLLSKQGKVSRLVI